MTATYLDEDWLLVPKLAPSTTDDPLTPLYAGAAAGALVLPFCLACDLPLELEQRVCDGCATAGPVWRQVEPRGSVHSVTVVHRLEPGLIRTTEPYPVADVELHSGHRLVLGPLHPTKTAPAIGDPVTIGFRRLGAVALPAFAPSETEDSP
ncbi:OB-fold domain-containing protein [Cryptosporangium aurantiacum]|uniref:DUF35 OB-fold domain-containing protein, acyl-CoA-associated n=1 Tax=Cryptosporangium aurantiacum TaxID=134849 RepID=A0A1M7PKW5_9ACTN|nr:OB-fold domain-containing protein [Cryptosporangium aurantiacum]SHN17642.1 DUF35 OB-fold domain-containing protein, acyl-CoA-associated [Cryptosporangium aurantiacum]